MLKNFITLFTLVVLFISIIVASSCSAFECREDQKVETCTLCNHCTNINLSLEHITIKPVYRQTTCPSLGFTLSLFENKIPNLLFRPPIS